MRSPRLRCDVVAVRLDDGHLVLLGEGRSLLIDDPATADLAELLDGTRALDDVLAQLVGQHPVTALTGSLSRLRALGLLATGAPATRTGQTAGWDARQVEPAAAERWHREATVVLADLGSPSVQVLATAVRALGPTVHVVDADTVVGGMPAPAGTMLVVAPASMVDPRLAAVNARCLATGQDWTLIRPHGDVVLVGPHLVPGRTGCWACLRQRWRENEQIESYLEARLPDRPRYTAARAALPATAMAAAGLLAADLPVLALRGSSPRLTGRMLALDTRDLTADTHELIRQPQCPACGDPTLLHQPAGPVELGAGTDRGGSRTVAPDRTYQLVSRHVSRYLGVVTRLSRLDAVDDGVTHTFSAGHNFALPADPLMLKRNLRGHSGGKGTTALQAKVSAIGEAIERYCGVWRGDRPTRLASYAQLGPDAAVHPRDLLLFSQRQYAERERRNRELSHFHRVPRPLSDGTPVAWTTGWSLTRETPRELPAGYCWYGHPDIARIGAYHADSNGCAAGNTIAEAILQGFCELVERDSVALWWYHRSTVPGVDLPSFDDPWIDALIAHHATGLGRELWALDLTADLGVPVFAALSRTVGQPTEDIVLGFGAHLDPRVALRRALTEANQFLPAVTPRPGARSRYGIADPDTVRWFSTVRLAEQPWLRPDPSRPPTRAGQLTARGTGVVADDVRACVRLAADAGLEVIAVDQSRPDLELNVVKVVVPGLRHFWRRLGPGRLWQVPVQLGRSPLAGDEDQINPLNVFF